MTAIDLRRNKAKISGERVLVDISLSGQVISISGQTVYVDPLSISGLSVVASVTLSDISGDSVRISGEAVKVSGEAVKISGETVKVDQLSLSGLNVVATVNTTVVTNISGQAVKVSGEAVKISGETVKAEISGQLVAISGVIDARISGQAVKISGETISIGNSPIARISGMAVRISGEAVKISGETVKAEISGQTISIDPVSISGLNVVASVTLSDISGDSVRISGEAVKVSGETVKAEISGQVVRLGEASGTNIAGIAGNTTTDASAVTHPVLRVMSHLHGFDGISGWTRLRVRGSGQGFLLVDVSGQPVSISGQTVAIDPASISGLNVVAITNVSGQAIRVSGEAVKISGETVKAEISGQKVRISGEAVQISGQTVATSISGQPVGVSGAAVKISGQTVIAEISGQTVSIDPLSISGLNVVANVVTNVSGNVVRISGEAVKVSGETVIAEISGQRVRISGETVKISGEKVRISGEAVKISGETVVAKISGETVVANVSGNTIRLGTATDIVAAGGTSADGASVLANVLSVAGHNFGFDGLSGWTRVRVRGSGDGYLLVDTSGSTVKVDPVSISGLNVVATVVTNISGQTVVAEISGQKVRISGETVIAKISGEKVRISGELVAVSGIVVAKVSGEAVKVSGEAIRITDGGGFIAEMGTNTIGDGATLNNTTLLSRSYLYGFDGLSGWTRVRVRGSGDGYILVDVSGSTVSIDPVSISGLNVVTTVVTNVSGNVVKISGEKVRISGEAVQISGQTIIAEISGETVKISGEKVRISGETVIAEISGESIKISGQIVHAIITDTGGSLQAEVYNTAVSTITEAIEVLGTASLTYGHVPSNAEWRRVALATYAGNKLNTAVSGDAVKVSGETISVSGIVQPRLPTAIITSDEVVIASVSGGTSLGSGVVSSVTVRAHVSASGLYWVGGNTTGYYANSGRGLQLSRGDGVTMMIDNVNRIRIHAQISGDRVSYIGQAY